MENRIPKSRRRSQEQRNRLFCPTPRQVPAEGLTPAALWAIMPSLYLPNRIAMKPNPAKPVSPAGAMPPAMILCGGMGTRLRDVTVPLPKPVVPACGHPVSGISCAAAPPSASPGLFRVRVTNRTVA